MTHQTDATATALFPRSVPILEEQFANDAEPDQPFQEGVHDIIDPDLRHRLISEAAYALYVQRGYADGFDVDDWLAAEGQLDRVSVERAGAGTRLA
jgi:hypothetical protein